MKCTNCGAEFEEGTLFCPRCGKEIQWVPEYNTLETLIKQKEMQDQEKKKKEEEAQKEKERAEKKIELERRKKRKKKKILISTAAAIIAAGAGGLLMIYQTQNNSFDFQMAQAESEFSNKDYVSALKYVDRALDLNPESPEANILEAKIFMKDGDEEAGLSLLLSVVEKHPDNINAYGELLRYYAQKEQYEEIRNLLSDASSEVRSTYQSYISELPQVSKTSGTYTEALDITFYSMPDGAKIYYTLDGSEPDMSSTLYQGSIPLEEEGTYTLKYISYNEKSIPSIIGEEKYEIAFEAPDAPIIFPASGKYSSMTSITVTAQTGCEIYYAFDSEPTTDSYKYTDPVTMPEGEHSFSAIAVNEKGKISPVATAVYVYYGE